MHCATNRLKVTNDYKKTNSAGQIVSNVSESIRPANDGLILFLGLRGVKERGGGVGGDTVVSIQVLYYMYVARVTQFLVF